MTPNFSDKQFQKLSIITANYFFTRIFKGHFSHTKFIIHSEVKLSIEKILFLIE